MIDDLKPGDRVYWNYPHHDFQAQNVTVVRVPVPYHKDKNVTVQTDDGEVHTIALAHELHPARQQ